MGSDQNRWHMEVEVRRSHKNRYGLQLEVFMINALRNNKMPIYRSHHSGQAIKNGIRSTGVREGRACLKIASAAVAGVNPWFTKQAITNSCGLSEIY